MSSCLLFAGYGLEVQGKPDRLRSRRGPFHAVARMRRNENIIAGVKHKGLGLALEEKRGCPGCQHDPFVPVLVIPLPRRRCLSTRHDALQPEGAASHQNFEGLLRGGSGQIR